MKDFYEILNPEYGPDGTFADEQAYLDYCELVEELTDDWEESCKNMAAFLKKKRLEEKVDG